MVEFIKHIENSINGRPGIVINLFRDNSISILDKFYKEYSRMDSNDKLLSYCPWLKFYQRFVKSHLEILITVVDKENITIILDKDDYKNGKHAF